MSEIIKPNKYVFKRDLSEYETNLNPTDQYVKQAGLFLTRLHGGNVADNKKVVKELLKGYEITNPIVKHNRKDENGDMHVKEVKLTEYINDALEDNRVIAPSFTTYTHPSKKLSLHSEFLDVNIKARSKEKKLAFKYKQAGDKDKHNYHNVLQKVLKVFNNSLSGAYASSGTVLNNNSAHYTLTSMTRCVASIGNSVSESMVAGNKHFKDPMLAINYITSIITNLNMSHVEKVVDKFGLKKPSSQEVLDMILFSSRNYWKDDEREALILELIESLSDYERCAVMYVNDLYHMRKHNDKFMRDLLGRMSERKIGDSIKVSDITDTAEGVSNLAHFICRDDIIGIDINYGELETFTRLEDEYNKTDDYNNPEITFKTWLANKGNKIDEKSFDKLYKDGKTPRKILSALASTALNVSKTLNEFAGLFRVFFVSNVSPVGIAHIREMLRDAIVLSDTDSTCASYDEWVEWYFGKQDFSALATALVGAVMTINVEVIDHNLRLLSKNMNVPKDLVDLLKMKNEFYWPVFINTNASKHYFAGTLICEGRVYNEMELERKGVHLIASQTTAEIRNAAEDLMNELMKRIENGEKLEITKYIKQVADLERYLISEINKGNVEILKTGKVKDPKSYKIEDKTKTPYLHHLLWKEVFSEKYGYPGEPTYMVVEVSSKLTTKARMTKFLDGIEDRNIADKFMKFMNKYGKETLGTFRCPLTIVGAEGVGLPEELKPAIYTDKIVMNNLKIFYIILESLGFYVKPDKLLISMGY